MHLLASCVKRNLGRRMRFNLRAGQLSAIVTAVLEAVVLPLLTGIEDGVSRLYAKRKLCNTGRVELKRSSTWQKVAGLGFRHRNWPQLLQQIVIFSTVIAAAVFEQGLEEKTERVVDTSRLQWVVDVQRNAYDSGTMLWDAPEAEREHFNTFGHKYRKYLSLQGRACMKQDENSLIISGPVIENELVVGCLGTNDFISASEVPNLRLPRVKSVVSAPYAASDMFFLYSYTVWNTSYGDSRFFMGTTATSSTPALFVNSRHCFSTSLVRNPESQWDGAKTDGKSPCSCCGTTPNSNDVRISTECACMGAYTVCIAQGGTGSNDDPISEASAKASDIRCISSLSESSALVESYCRGDGCEGRFGFEEGEGYHSILFRNIDRNPGLLAAAIVNSEGGMHAKLGSIALAVIMLSTPVARKGSYRLVDGRIYTISPKLFLYFLAVPCVLLFQVCVIAFISWNSTKLTDERSFVARLKGTDILDNIYDGRNIASNLAPHQHELERVIRPRRKVIARLEEAGDCWHLWYECQEERDERFQQLQTLVDGGLEERGSAEIDPNAGKQRRLVMRNKIRGTSTQVEC